MTVFLLGLSFGCDGHDLYGYASFQSACLGDSNHAITTLLKSSSLSFAICNPVAVVREPSSNLRQRLNAIAISY